MDLFLDIAPFLLLALYGLVAVGYGVLFFTGNATARRSVPPLLKLTVLFHVGYLVFTAWRWNQFPAATVSQVLTFVACAVAIVYVLLERIGDDRSTGLWTTGQIFLFQLLAVVFTRPEPPRHEVFEEPLFAIHVALALLGYAAFATAASYGFLFLRLYRGLKGDRLSVFYGKLPPLQVLERMMTGALVVGFVALTGAVLDGTIWMRQVAPQTWFRDPMIVVTLATWALYGGALLLKRMRRWHGRQTAVASLAGIGVIVVSLVAHYFIPAFHPTLQ